MNKLNLMPGAVKYTLDGDYDWVCTAKQVALHPVFTVFPSQANITFIPGPDSLNNTVKSEFIY